MERFILGSARVAGTWAERSGASKYLPDPPALAHHVAEWMTAGGARGAQARSVCRSPADRRRRRSTGCSPRMSSAAVSPGSACPGTGAMSASFPYDHPDSNYRMTREAMLAKAPVPPENIHPVPTDGTPDDAARRYERTLQEAYGAATLDPATPAFRCHPARAWSRWPYRFAAAWRAGAGRAQALGGRRLAWAARGPHHHDLSGDREQPACRISGGGRGEGGDLRRDPRWQQQVPAARVRPVGELLWFVDQAAAGGEQVPRRTGARAR